METYTRKQLISITGLPDKTLRWLLSRLEISPVDVKKTAFGRPIYYYDKATLLKLHDYVFNQLLKKQESANGVRCRGGCNKFFPRNQLSSDQLCPHCKRIQLLRKEVYDEHGNINTEVVDDLIQILTAIKNDY